MIARERDGHEHSALLVEAHETIEGVDRLRAHRRTGPDLGLPYEAVGIRVAQTVHHRYHGRGNLEHVRVAPVDDVHWERMGREKQHNIATFVLWESLESSFDILGDGLVQIEGYKWVQGGRGAVHARLDKARMCTSTINDAPADAGKQPGFALSVNVIKTAARRATAVLRVLRKRYRALHMILLHPSRGLIRQRGS